jgi:hypothetical protein
VADRYGPERRLLDHVRTWIDVFPWLRLVRVCRIAGGPVWLMHTLLVMFVWMVGLRWLGGEQPSPDGSWMSNPAIMLPLSTTLMPGDWIAPIPGSTTFASSLNWQIIVWTILLWMPTAMALVRVGALLTAGQDMPSYITTFRAVAVRLRGALIILLVPALAAALFWGIAAGASWLAEFVGGESDRATWASWLTLPIVLPATVVASVFLVAGKFAVPLALTALMVESDADPIDSLSRGYEYTLRRLLQLGLLCIVAVSISAFVVMAWVGLSNVGQTLATSFGSPHRELPRCLSILPAVVAIMLLWSMIGGIYLLLRQSANGQEVEDLAIEPGHWKSPRLPSVQS